MSPEAQIGLSLATILFSGVVSAGVAFALRAEWEDRAVLRDKLEAAHRAFHDFADDLSMGWIHAMVPKEAEPTTKKVGHSELDQLETLIALYFPQLKPYRDRLLAIRDEAATPLMVALKAKTDKKRVSTDVISIFQLLTKRVTTLKEEFDREVRSVAHSIRPGGFIWRR